MGKTRNDPNVKPIVLSEDSYRETWEIQPYQWFWKRWFGDEMPKLSLMIENGTLYIRATKGIESKKYSLKEFEKNSRWNERSAYVIDFAVDDFERKIVVLDIEAKRDGKSIIIEHARIRYPEVRLDILN